MNYILTTLGCKVNQYEGAALAAEMKKAGFSSSDNPEKADIFILNSCTVTETSDKKALRDLSRFRRENPNAVIVLTGCYPQAFPEEAKKICQSGCADIIVGGGEKNSIPAKIKAFLAGGGRNADIMPLPVSYENVPVFEDGDKTRAFVKIEDGCDRFCSYCIIPFARGRVRSRAIDDICAEVRLRAAAGCREIVLVGINLSCYGKDIGLRLADAVEAVCNEPLVGRVRLGSIEPELLTDEDMDRLSAQPKLCPHFHLSLQSGCDETLRRMNRHYTASEYAEIVDKLRERFPSAAFTTDIMAGFAGETEDELKETLAFAEKIGFAKMHVFTYSIRTGTAAARRTDHLPESVKNEHYRKITELDRKMSADFLKKQIGTRQTILVERRTSPDFIYGHTANYTLVRVYGANAPRYSELDVKIIEACDGYCKGICE